MIRADEIREGSGQIQFSLRVLETTPLRLKKGAVAADWGRPGTPNSLSLSISRVMAGVAPALRALSQLVWAFLRLWLVEQ